MHPSCTLLVAIVSVNLVSVTTGQVALPSDELHYEVTITPELKAKSEALCQELVKDPFFEPEMVVDAPWRVYYMWKMRIEKICIDLRFKIATPMMIRQFYYDTNEYLQEQPAWGAASLLLKMGQSQHQLLLFDDQGPAGKLIGVPNVLRDSGPRLSPLKHAVPLLKFQLKLTRDGKYLIFMDCKVGITSLAARLDQPLDRAEIDKIAATFSAEFGQGYHACVPDKDLNNKQ